MRIIGPEALRPLEGRMINLHPSLLPKYRGTQTYRRALDAGDLVHGASIHFVSEELDGGPVLAQVTIPILPGDDETSLAGRLAPMEHLLIVAAVEFMASREVECRDDEIFVDGNRLEKPLQLGEDHALA
jgi:phosphoribosylglycinamide formyltransferase-1